MFDTDGNITTLRQYGSKGFPLYPEDENSIKIGGLDALYDVIQTSDGNYMCVGHSNSYDNDLGPMDETQYWAAWFLKIDTEGKKISSKKISHDIDGLSDYIHHMYKIIETEDGDFIGLGDIYGETGSFWIFRTDGVDNTKKMWSKTYSTNEFLIVSSMAKKDENTYVVCGWIEGGTGDVSESVKGGVDIWVFEIDAKTGKMGRQKVFGGAGSDAPKDIIALKNGNVLLAGISNSKDGDSFGGFGSQDFWLLELDNNLDTLLTHKIGGSAYEDLTGVAESQDGTAFFIVGSSESNDVFVNKNQGYLDIFVTKIIANSTLSVKNINSKENNIFCTPNPSNGKFNIINAENKTVYITDVTGRKIYKSFVKEDYKNINLQNFPKGIYFLNIKNENKTIKIIVN